MNKWINEQMNKWTNEQMNKWINEQMNKWIPKWINEPMNKWINEQMNKWINEQFETYKYFLKEQDQIQCNNSSVEHIEQEEKCFALLHARIE